MIRSAVVIEDTDGDRELVIQLLHSAGVEQVDGYTGFPERFDPPLDATTLVILDLVLGAGADGVQALEAIAKAGARAAPIVIVSGQLEPILTVIETYGKALGLNVVATSGKPVPLDLLSSLVRTLDGA